MEVKDQMTDKIFIDKCKVIYIYSINIILYILLNVGLNYDNIKIAMICRMYYIISCLNLFIWLKQIKRFNNQYVSKIIWLFFSLIMIISMLGFLDNVRSNGVLCRYIQYMDLSISIILLLEVFLCYILSEYYFRNRKSNKLPYIVMGIIIISMILTYHYKILFNVIKISFFILELPLLFKIYTNIRKIDIKNKKKINAIKFCIISIIFVLLINVYEFYTNKYKFTSGIIEIVHISNFTMIWVVTLRNFAIEPYKVLANSLSNETKELDNLNERIIIKNRELEQSINILRKNEHLYSTFFRYMPHPVIILNSNNERILFVNKQFLKMSEISSLKDIVNEKISRYIEFIKDDLVNKDYNAILTVKDKKKYIYITILPEDLQNGRKIILIKDNTSNVIKEEIEKEVKNKKIEENMRTQFLSSISHDLKTPINVIYSASQIEELYIQKKDFNTLIKYNAICKHNCISLIKLTNNLIDNSQINFNYLAPRLRKYNLVEIVEDSVMSLVEYVKWNDIDLIFDTNTEECYIHIDQEFMERIILNLVSNSVKFTRKNGEIHVIIHENRDYVRISVKDNGVGMKKDFVNKVFNRYEIGESQSKKFKSESGIGLFVVKELVEMQGGKIYIESNVTIGTNITIQFKKEK